MILVGLTGCGGQESKGFRNAASVKRLDGSTIAAEEIDGTVKRVMGVGENDGRRPGHSQRRKIVGALMGERVFRPLGMTRTSITWRLGFETNHAEGYDEQETLGSESRLQADATGSMLTAPRDFARFTEAVMQGERLPKETSEVVLSPQIAILSKHEFPPLSTETTEENKRIRLSYGLAWGLYWGLCWTPYGKAFFKEGHDDS